MHSIRFALVWQGMRGREHETYGQLIVQLPSLCCVILSPLSPLHPLFISLYVSSLSFCLPPTLSHCPPLSLPFLLLRFLLLSPLSDCGGVHHTDFDRSLALLCETDFLLFRSHADTIDCYRQVGLHGQEGGDCLEVTGKSPLTTTVCSPIPVQTMAMLCVNGVLFL